MIKTHDYDGLKKFMPGPLEEGFADPDPAHYGATGGVVGLAALQIALVDVLLKECCVEIGGMLGHSAGEIAMGYADGCLILEETMSTAFYRSLCGANSVDPKNPGGMFAAGLGRKKAEEMLQKYNCTAVSQVGCDN